MQAAASACSQLGGPRERPARRACEMPWRYSARVTGRDSSAIRDALQRGTVPVHRVHKAVLGNFIGVDLEYRTLFREVSRHDEVADQQAAHHDAVSVDLQFSRFWNEYGRVLKENILQDFEHKDQKAIYFLAGGREAGLHSSPRLEACKARGIEVLVEGAELTDPVAFVQRVGR